MYSNLNFYLLAPLFVCIISVVGCGYPEEDLIQTGIEQTGDNSTSNKALILYQEPFIPIMSNRFNILDTESSE